MLRRRRVHPAIVLMAMLLLCPADAQATTIAKAHLPRKPFKIYKGNLSAEEQPCLRYALKQWVMYDVAPAGDGNRNESHDHVTAAGPKHKPEDVIDKNHPEKSHARSSRPMSEWEKGKMRQVYGASSPFHVPGDTVKDPVHDAGLFVCRVSIGAERASVVVVRVQ